MSTVFDVVPTDILHDRRIDNVLRIEVGDSRPYPQCEHVWDYPGHEGEWFWSDRTRFAPNLTSPEMWCYAVYFSDGTKGVCRVRDLNRALAACNYRIGEMLSRSPT